MEILLKKNPALPPPRAWAEAARDRLSVSTPPRVSVARRATPTVTAAVAGQPSPRWSCDVPQATAVAARQQPRPYKVACDDNSGRIDHIFFHSTATTVRRRHWPTVSIRIVIAATSKA